MHVHWEFAEQANFNALLFLVNTEVTRIGRSENLVCIQTTARLVSTQEVYFP
jgi:hypothetical protein